MSDYWKSNPRKFCDFCKCWIADNKPSIEFHERGKRHKENVQKRLEEIGRKGQEEYEAKQQEGDFLKAMEEAALKAYKNDIEQNPDMTGSKISEIAAASNAEIVIGKKNTSHTKIQAVSVIKNWYEAKTSEGCTYYWNIETGESKWDEPKEGFLTIAEQENLSNKNDNSSLAQVSEHISSSKESSAADTPQGCNNNSTSVSSKAVIYGPAPRAKAYSSWQQVETDSQQHSVDYQLPEIVEEGYYGPEVSFKKPEVSFEERTVTLSANDRDSCGNVAFKKRKAAHESKKSMRRRTDDL